jgi:fatty-acyl-CoA synthase
MNLKGYVRRIMDNNLLNKSILYNIEEKSKKNPYKDLIKIGDESLKFGTFIESVKNLSLAMKYNDFKLNSKIGIVIPNMVIWYEIFWGIVKFGGVPVPLDPQTGQWEFERLIDMADIEYCFVADKYRANNIIDNLLKAKDKLPNLKRIVMITGDIKEVYGEEVISFDEFLNFSKSENEEILNKEVNKDKALMMACTSGTTGNPKIVQVPHLGFLKSQLDMANYLGFEEDDKMLLAMPLYHQGGLGMGLQMILKGGTLIYQKIFNPEKFLEIIEKEKITVLQLTPTLAKVILTVPEFSNYDISSVRMCYFAGEVLPDELAKKIYIDLNIRVVNCIGSTETATMVVWDSKTDSKYEVNNFKEMDFTKVKLLDKNLKEVKKGETGTIYVHTDALVMKYYKNENETKLKLRTIDDLIWFNTGDIAKKNNEERIIYVGREKRAIKRGANLVWPEELESFLVMEEKIQKVAVMGKKHEIFGESIVAYIKTKEGYKLNKSDIIKICKNKLAAYKIPDEVIFLDDIPHDMGKVQYKYIRNNE